jgi:hypothetical protein
VRRLAVLVILGLSPACDDGVEQAPACARYTACIRALDERVERETNLDRFDPGGACWGSVEGGTLCARACTRGLAWEAMRNPDPPAECRS